MMAHSDPEPNVSVAHVYAKGAAIVEILTSHQHKHRHHRTRLFLSSLGSSKLCGGQRYDERGRSGPRRPRPIVVRSRINGCAGSIRNHSDKTRSASRLCISERYERSANRIPNESRTTAGA